MMFYLIFYFDPTYVLTLIDIVISMTVSAKLNSTYQRYSAVRSMCTVAGAGAAKRLLTSQGIYDVTVRRAPDNLTDRYDPRSETVSLSDVVYNSTSIAAVGVTAHKCDHAMQDVSDYSLLGIRAVLMPAANLGSQLCRPLIIIGFLLGGSSAFLNLGILLLCLVVSFQLATLSVEYDASHRAVNPLSSTGTLVGQEVGQTRRVLNVATLTYVAATAASVLQLFRLLILFDNHRNDQGGDSYSDRP